MSQAVIGNYAVPILEDRAVYGTTDETRTAYLDSQDAARMALAALRWVAHMLLGCPEGEWGVHTHMHTLPCCCCCCCSSDLCKVATLSALLHS